MQQDTCTQINTATFFIKTNKKKQMSINSRMDKYIMVYIHNKKLYRHENEHNYSKIQQHGLNLTNIMTNERKLKEYIQCDSMYVRFKNRNNYIIFFKNAYIAIMKSNDDQMSG